MLARLKRASRRSIAFVWAMSAMFAMAPALSMSLASPLGAFSRSFIHVHAADEPGHVHHDHHHHHYDHDHDGDHGHHHDGGTNDGQDHDRGQQRLHVHYDASCPSVVIPAQNGSALPHRLSGRMAILRVEPMQGAPPGRLLRPPILAS
jgi:hypothetical protein